MSSVVPLQSHSSTNAGGGMKAFAVSLENTAATALSSTHTGASVKAVTSTSSTQPKTDGQVRGNMNETNTSTISAGASPPPRIPISQQVCVQQGHPLRIASRNRSGEDGEWSNSSSDSLGEDPALESLDLPFSLTLLYFAADEVDEEVDMYDSSERNHINEYGRDYHHYTAHRRHPYALLYLLETLAHSRAVRRRARRSRQRKRAGRERCVELYVTGVSRQRETEAHAEQKRQALAEMEMAACTFTPRLSKAARRRRGKGRETFLARCIEWQQKTARKLAAKYPETSQDGKAVSVPSGPVMSEGSRKILSRSRGITPRQPLWQPRSYAAETKTAESRGKDEAMSLQALAAEGVGDTFSRSLGTGAAAAAHEPLTTARIEEQRELLYQLTRRSPCKGAAASGNLNTGDEDKDLNGCDGGRCGLRKLQPSSSPSAAERHYLARMEADMIKRVQNAEKLRLTSAGGTCDGEKYDPVTGKPYFQPNALPTRVVETEGDDSLGVSSKTKRIPFDKWPQEEQEALCKKLRAKRQEHLLVKFFRDGKEKKRKKDGADTCHSILDKLEAEEERRQRNLTRLREERDARATFHPSISPYTARLAKRKLANRQPLYPGSTPTASAEPGVSLASSCSPRGSAAAAPRPFFAITSAERVEAVALRANMWQEGKETRLLRAREEKAIREKDGCTFAPQLSSVHTFRPAGTYSPSPIPHHSSDMASGEDGSYIDDAEARRRRYSQQTRDGLAAAAKVRLVNELELLRDHPVFQDPVFLESVARAESVGQVPGAAAMYCLPYAGGGEATPLATGRSGNTNATAKSASMDYGYSLLNANSAGTPSAATRLALSRLSFQNAPRLPRQLGDSPPPHGTASFLHNAGDVSGAARGVSLSGASPIAQRTYMLSKSRSPPNAAAQMQQQEHQHVTWPARVKGKDACDSVPAPWSHTHHDDQDERVGSDDDGGSWTALDNITDAILRGEGLA